MRRGIVNLWSLCVCMGVSAMGLSEMASGADVVRAYVGTYTDKGSEGVYVLELDRDTGTVTEARVAAQQKSPSFLAITRTINSCMP